MPNVAFLEASADAWNRHDVDAIMASMTKDCVFVTSGGDRFEGQESVREIFVDIIGSFEDLRFEDPNHFADGERGLSEWTFCGTDTEDGEQMEIEGCDPFTFRDGLIAVKNTYEELKAEPLRHQDTKTPRHEEDEGEAKSPKTRLTVDVSEVEVKNVLTRTTGVLKTVTSHSLQLYRGCSYGNSMCGAGCYVQHSFWVTKGRKWESFLEVRRNAAEAYVTWVDAERRWAQKSGGQFGVFMSSSTDPFVPQEKKYGITKSILNGMIASPPDVLILQTHSHQVVSYMDLILSLDEKCDLRVHLSTETDRESFPGLPAHASPISGRFDAARKLKESGLRVVVTVSPLMPIEKPDVFFARIAASAVVIDHFIEGDGSRDGRRTLQTALPEAIRSVDAEGVDLEYRDRMVEVAEKYMPGRVGVNVDGFAGRYGKAES